MATSDPETPSKSLAARSEMSDDFIFPLAPPASPSPSRSGSGTKSPPNKSPKNTATVTAIPPAVTTKSPTATQPLLLPEPSGGSDVPIEYPTHSTEEPKSNSLVVGLCVAVAVLLVVIVIQHKSEPERNPSVIASSSAYEVQLAKARADADFARRERARIAERMSGLEEQLEATQNAADRKHSSLLEAYNNLSSQRSDLASENFRLKSQLQAAAKPDTGLELPPPSQKAPELTPHDQNVPEVQQGGQAYRVVGLRPGDTLNLRSGPGTNYSVISAIPNGVKVTVTGDAVMNGPDAWLPCVFRMSMVDPDTGIKKVWAQKCWINSYFVEPESN
jgi:hypothetical protein